MSNSNQRISESELIINPDGSIYHLAVKPGEVAPTIITVGDPERIDAVTKHFDKVLMTKQRREFKTVTGEISGQAMTVISTGIGTDNIDIVFNEIDALFNIDFQTRSIKQEHTQVRFIRLGTSGCLQTDIPVDTILISHHAIGLEGLMGYYNYEMSPFEKQLSKKVKEVVGLPFAPEVIAADSRLLQVFEQHFISGITCTASGFYAPQGRSIRLQNRYPNFIHDLSAVEIDGTRITNLEMETAGIYGMSKMLGHQAISISALLANRINGEFSADPQGIVAHMIEKSLDILIN